MDNQEKIAQNFIKDFLNEDQTPPQSNQTSHKRNDFFQDLPLQSLPLNRLYHPNTRIEIRALDLGEITNYSTLESEDSNLVRTKLDEILSSCVKMSIASKKLNYKHLLVADRLYMIFTLRELTFQSGKFLTVPVDCENDKCLNKFEIELIRQNFELWSDQEEIWQFFKPEYGAFVFQTTIQDEPYILRPPTIGIQESFYYWINHKKYLNEEINPSFVKIAPYTINAVELSIDEMNELQKDWLDHLKQHPKGEEEFLFLNDTVDRFKNNDFKLGIRGLLKKCPKCGQEVRTKNIFPKRARDLFIIPNAFFSYLKK